MEPRRIRRGNWRRYPYRVRHRRGFNGAAANSPRKRTTSSARSRISARFNGAAANSPRKQPVPPVVRLAPPCFNGAAANSPRKPQLHSPTQEHTAWLQWSRGEFTAETGHGHLPAVPAPPSFNGAAANSPRKRRVRPGWSRRPRRFNGAAANSPRKQNPTREGADAFMSGFNGAAANSRRKRRPVGLRQIERLASMEPRRIRRGNLGAKGTSTNRSTSFNGAAANSPRKRGGAARGLGRLGGLQWSRGEFAAETAFLARLREIKHMLQWSRGEFAAETADPEASFRWRYPLQWSRGEFAAETGPGTRDSRAARLLQWSRGEFAAETPTYAPQRFFFFAASMEPRRIRRGNTPETARLCRARWGFNGAAANSPRKRGNATAEGSATPGLQWSRGEFAAETTPIPARLWLARLRFNGAAANSPRKQNSSSLLTAAPPRFNGAAANSPRKPALCP